MDANNHEMKYKKERKVRSDKGIVIATRRDLYCIAWMAEQYAARADQIQQLLSKFPDAKRPFKDELIAETTVRDQISRWKRAGWIEYRRVLADQPGFAWVTRRGLQLVDLDEIYTARAPAGIRLDHIYAINQVRLLMDKQFTWKSERRYRSEQEIGKKGKDIGPLPDGVITTRDGRVAIEVEITTKKPAELEAKLIRLARCWDYANGRQSLRFPRIAFFVPTRKVADLIVSVGEEKLRADEWDRVTIDVRDDLLPN